MSDIALERATAIAVSVRDAGGRALIVGGWVRDRLMGRDTGSKDIDIEVYGLPSDRVRSLLESLGRVEAVGESFQVYKIGDIDVSLPRRESKSGRGHRGFDVAGDPSMTFAEAARRRDFTINAIGWDPLSGEYLDPYDGRGDLDRRILRVVDPATFSDDSLRALRAVQFAARFDLQLDQPTRVLCRTMALDDLPQERIWGEIEKLLLAPRPSIGLALALELSIVAQLFPELAALVGCPQEPEWHPERRRLCTHCRSSIRHDSASTICSWPQQLRWMPAPRADFGKPGHTGKDRRRIRSLDHRSKASRPRFCFSIASTFTRLTATMCADRLRDLSHSVSSPARGSRFATKSVTARSAAWRTKSISNCWHCWLNRIALAASPGISIARRWTGSSNVRARSASSIGRRRRSSSGGISLNSVSNPDRASGDSESRVNSRWTVR